MGEISVHKLNFLKPENKNSNDYQIGPYTVLACFLLVMRLFFFGTMKGENSNHKLVVVVELLFVSL